MSRKEIKNSIESQPFKGLKVYYSGSIKGVPEQDPQFPWKLVKYMSERGADVLSEHVAARTPEEMESIRASRIGEKVKEIIGHPEPWFTVREIDVEWVDKATHVVSLVNTPSHGVGMEIERALLKPKIGLNFTPILCLIKEDFLEKLSYMVRGIKDEGFFLKTYQNIFDAKSLVNDFLLGKLKKSK